MQRQVFVSNLESNQSNMTPEFSHNLMTMEISNNWLFVNELIEKTQKGKTLEVDLLERDWLIFLNKNNINIKFYKNKEDFIDKNLKSLVN